jgi:glutathione S-transferase
MILTMYLHPFSSYCQKAKMALYEKGGPFETKMLDGSEPVASEFAALWPISKFPVAVDGDRLIFGATSIIEHLDVAYPDGILLRRRGPHVGPFLR